MNGVIKNLMGVVIFITFLFSQEISLTTAKFDPIRDGEPQIPLELKEKEEDTTIYILQFIGPIKNYWKITLKEKGVKIYGYIPHYAFLVKMESSKKEEILSLPFIRWIGVYHPYYKISPKCFEVKEDDFKGGYLVKDYGFKEVYDPLYINLPDLKSYVLYLLPDADVKEVSLRLSSFCEIKNVLPYPSNRIIVWTSPSNINSIARIKEVYYIFPYYPKTLFNNTTKYVLQSYVLTVQANNTPQTGMDTVVAGNLPVWDRNIKGQGQIVTVMDTGVDYYSCWFRDPNNNPPGPNHIVIYDYTNEGGDLQDDQNCGHGTHVSGTVAGDPTRGGANNIADYQGHAYMGKIYMQDIGYYGGTPPRCRLNINNFLNSANTAYNKGSRIHTNSWGYGGLFPPYGDYVYEAIDVDIFSFSHQDFLFIFSAGNDGPNPNTVLPPSTAKDCISVGSTWRHSYDGTADNISDFSSRGPTDDNRYKPDLMTPGGKTPYTEWRHYITSAYPAATWGSQTCRIAGMVGTSMAAPAVAGCAALVRQYYLEGYYPTGSANPSNSISPSGALIKATLLLSTRDMTGVTGYPNYNEGWGRICLDDALYFSGDSRKLLIHDNTIGLPPGQSYEYSLNVGSSAQPLKIVLVWHDTAAAANANPTLVNDLDLIVYAPDGNTYYGNYFSGGQSAPGGSADRRNNVEVFLLNTPPIGNYTVRVSAYNVPYGPQPYAITIAGEQIALGEHEVYTEIRAKILSSGIKIEWNTLPEIYYYEVYRKESEHTPYKLISLVKENSLLDKDVKENKTYWYNVKGYSSDGDFIKDFGEIKIRYIKEIVKIKKFKTILRGGNVITYEILKDAFVFLEIYDISGRVIRKIVEGKKTPGIYKIYWDGKDEKGKELPSGKYLCILFVNNEPIKQSFIMLK